MAITQATPEIGLKTGGLQTGGLQTGGLDDNFAKFSRIGMGLQEQRVEEADRRGVQEGAQNFKRRERIGRRAYRQALRQNDPGKAFDVLNAMNDQGLSSGGIRQAGAVENRLMSQFENRKSMLSPHPQTQQMAPTQGAPSSIALPSPGAQQGLVPYRLPEAQGPPVPVEIQGPPVPATQGSLSRGSTMEMRNWEGVQNGKLGDRGPGDGLDMITAGSAPQVAQSPVDGLMSRLLGQSQNKGIVPFRLPEQFGPPASLAQPSPPESSPAPSASVLMTSFNQSVQDRQKAGLIDAERRRQEAAKARAEKNSKIEVPAWAEGTAAGWLMRKLQTSVI